MLCRPRDRSGRSAWLKVVPGLTPDSIQQNRLRRSPRGPTRPVAADVGRRKTFPHGLDPIRKSRLTKL